MKSINLIFGCHSHQPVGNFGFVFEEAFEKAYVPFLDVLERFPAVHVTLHFTGPLLDWFAAEHPEFMQRLSELVKRGQIEIMGGGYYEPLLCAIPERDAIAQIERMAAVCQDHFGKAPPGMWLAERVWEPHMPSILARAGIEYTALDDAHFLGSGLAPEQLFGHYMTEDQGYALKVFPILERLRYIIPFRPVEETIAFLEQHATEDGLRCAVIHDDGEKFGIWPGTNHSVYEEGWLEDFFQALTDNQEWIHALTYEEYLDKAEAQGRTYLTCASYQEMMAWVLPTGLQRRLHDVFEELKGDTERAARYGPFLRGGFWRGFLAKYDESNNLQKRMIQVSNRVEALRAQHKDDATWQEALRLLHEGQCNCSYWHGVFGGLYLNHLRTAIYERLIAADRSLDQAEGHGAGWVSCRRFDFDTDGKDEAVLENTRLALYFNPSDGGTLFEVDYKDKPFNFGNTLMRREEPYHDALRSGQVQVSEETDGDQSIHDMVKAKEAGLDAFLIYDPYRRVSLRDHFFPPEVDTDALWRGTQEDWGDFAKASYTLDTGPDKVTMRFQGPVATHGAVTVCKTICLEADASAAEIRYDIAHHSDGPLEVCFGVEFACNLLTGSAPDRYYRSDDRDLGRPMLAMRGCEQGLRHVALCDEWQAFEFGLRFDTPADVHCFAIETVSQSEVGQERVYQGSMVVPCWPLCIAPGQKQSLRVRIEIVETAGP